MRYYSWIMNINVIFDASVLVVAIGLRLQRKKSHDLTR